MARVSKEDIARLQGLQRALEIVKKDGVEALEKEIKFRCATKIPIDVNYEKCVNAIGEVAETLAKGYSENILETVLAMSMLVLNEEFQFGKVRLGRFKKKFSDNTDQLRSGDLDWDAIREIFMEEYGIEFDFSKEILAIGKAK